MPFLISFLAEIEAQQIYMYQYKVIIFKVKLPSKSLNIVFYLLLCILTTALPVNAMNFEGDGNLDILADELTFDKKTEKIQAKGNVKITYGSTTLETNSIQYDQHEARATTSESFILNDGFGTVRGEALDYNFHTSTGSFSHGNIFIKEDNYHITGDIIEQRGEKKYFIKRGYFTTCDGENPSWTIGASNVNLELGEYLFAGHAVLYLKSLPVIYFPKVAFPVKTERQTGLLSPKIGYSNRDGFTYSQPFFWAISRNKDATFTLNHEGSRGAGADVEYRYIRNQDSRGDLVYQYVNEKNPAVRKRWAGALKYRENFSPALFGSADLNLVSDRDFFLDYGDNVTAYSRQKLESRASLVKNWLYSSLLLEFRYFENLVLDEDTTLQRLPVITYTRQVRQIYETPLFLQVESNLNNFWRKDTIETSGLISGQRFDMHPTISLPLNPRNIFELTPRLGLRETIYYTKEKQDRWDAREIYDFNIDFLIPVSRVYDMQWGGVDRIKHTVEPGFTYTYLPDRDQSELPSYDGIDRISRTKTLRFKLNNSIVTKRVADGNAFYHRIVDLNIFRDYSFIEAERVLVSPNDTRKPWGLLTGQLHVTGEEGFRLNSEIRYDTYNDETSYFSADVEESFSAAGSFRFSYRRTISPVVSYLDSTVKLAPFRFLKLAYSGRYSIEKELFLESKYGLLLKHQCWDITLSYSERKIPRENKFFLTVNLRGLGEVGKKSDFFEELI